MAKYRNHYTCPECKGEWTDEWDCMVDDDCPHCGKRHISPDESEDIIEAETVPCHTCKTPTPIDLLDGKDDGTGNFTILECRKCYGPGWVPMNLDARIHELEDKGELTADEQEELAYLNEVYREAENAGQ